MTDRLEKKLSSIVEGGRKALALFLTAGYPSLDGTRDIVLALEEGGADIIELGMPFSDPLADGPVIQQSSAVALQNGVTLDVVLGQVEAIRQVSRIPIVLMGYLNPLFRYGADRFFARAAESGVDGVILPELPLEEAGRYRDQLEGRGLARILLVSPTTDPERVREIDRESSGFLYCVSTTGVTGSAVGGGALQYVRRVKRSVAKNPVLVGFGISSPDRAALFAREADGVIVGSALLKRLGENGSLSALVHWVAAFKGAIG